MTELGTARNYQELHALIRARVGSLGVTFETVDAIAGLPSRYATKLLSPVPMKAIGKISLGPLLGALGLKLIVAVDDEALARITGRLVQRARNQVGADAGMHTPKRKKKRGVWKGNSQWGKVMAARRKLVLSESKRTSLARHAARARWRGTRPIEVKP